MLSPRGLSIYMHGVCLVGETMKAMNELADRTLSEKRIPTALEVEQVVKGSQRERNLRQNDPAGKSSDTLI